MALSLNPQNINKESWYYEETKGIHLVRRVLQDGKYICTEDVLIPWRMIEKSLKRRDGSNKVKKRK